MSQTHNIMKNMVSMLNHRKQDLTITSGLNKNNYARAQGHYLWQLFSCPHRCCCRGTVADHYSIIAFRSARPAPEGHSHELYVRDNRLKRFESTGSSYGYSRNVTNITLFLNYSFFFYTFCCLVVILRRFGRGERNACGQVICLEFC